MGWKLEFENKLNALSEQHKNFSLHHAESPLHFPRGGCVTVFSVWCEKQGNKELCCWETLPLPRFEELFILLKFEKYQQELFTPVLNLDWRDEWLYRKCWESSLQHYLQLPRRGSSQVSISGWVDKKALVHLPKGILVSHKKEGNLTLCDSMERPGDYYAEWSKPVREK